LHTTIKNFPKPITGTVSAGEQRTEFVLEHLPTKSRLQRWQCTDLSGWNMGPLQRAGEEQRVSCALGDLV